jgi:hypothetical protein
MKATIEEYNEETQWDIQESSVVRDGHIKIATATAAMVNWNGEVTTTTEVMVGVFGSKDHLDFFAIWNTEDNLADKRHRDLIGTFLHQGPLDR